MLTGTRCVLRAYRHEDIAQLPLVAGDYDVARWMTHRFPHPYTIGDAEAWVAHASAESPVNDFAIVVDGTLAGGVGIRPLEAEESGVAVFGYWVGRAYWGRGIATEAASLLATHALTERGMRRLEAYVYAPNVASARVLEKCGFRCEGILRMAVVERDGTPTDSLVYSRLATDEPPRVEPIT